MGTAWRRSSLSDMSNYILLIAVLAVLVIGAVKGYTKGFLRLAVWFAGLIAVLFIVTKISPYVSDFLINNTTINENIRKNIITAYENKYVEDGTMDSLGFPELITDSIESDGGVSLYDRIAITIFTDYISGYLSTLAVKAGTFAGLFILLAVAEFILIMAIKILEKIPVLRTFNKLLGMACGITLSLVLVWVFFIAVMMFFGHSFGNWVFAQVKSSVFLSYLFNNNILFELVK